MAARNPQSQQVAEYLMEALNEEMVASMLRPHPPGSAEYDNACRKLEQIGFEAGYRFAERCSKDRERFADPLSVVKFVCKDVWTQLFLRPVDKLRTNHRGVYVMHVTEFRWLRYLTETEGHNVKLEAINYLVMPCGLIRGVLASLGLDGTVVADVNSFPECTFQCRVRAEA